MNSERPLFAVSSEGGLGDVTGSVEAGFSVLARCYHFSGKWEFLFPIEWNETLKTFSVRKKN